MLEEDIAVLVRAAHGGVLGVQSALAEVLHSLHIHHLSQVLIVPEGDLLDLVGGTEAVEEVDEGNAALDGGQMGHRGQVHDLLHVALGQHGKAGLAAGHHVGVVAEDVQGVGGHGTGGHMEHGGQQLTGDLVHVGDHQQQALRGGVGGGQGTGVQRAVNGTGGTGLRLHLDDFHGGAEDVLLALGGPLVHIVGHGAGRRDGVDARYLGEGVADIRSSVVAVHGFKFSCHRVPYFLPYLGLSRRSPACPSSLHIRPALSHPSADRRHDSAALRQRWRADLVFQRLLFYHSFVRL